MKNTREVQNHIVIDKFKRRAHLTHRKNLLMEGSRDRLVPTGRSSRLHSRVAWEAPMTSTEALIGDREAAATGLRRSLGAKAWLLEQMELQLEVELAAENAAAKTQTVKPIFYTSRGGA